jgi:SAM-dependent methyltransferase
VNDIKFINPYTNIPLKWQGENLVDQEGKSVRHENGVYKFVDDDNNYTSTFGFQWNKFAKTQIDGEGNSNSTQSKKRFFAATGWDKEDLTGKKILEVGSGAGRFSQVVLNHTQSELYSVDYSSAVEANFRQNGHHKRFKLFQASIYDMPFSPSQFDKVFCFGVLQHTPDFKKSVKSLVDMVKPGGELIIDFYPIKGWWTKISAKYILRPITKKIKKETLLRLITTNAGWMIALYRFFAMIGIGKITNRFIPICDIDFSLPQGLSKKELREWVILDTFDMFSPEYDNPQRLETVKKWVEEFGMKNVSAKMIEYDKNQRAAIVKGVR